MKLACSTTEAGLAQAALRPVQQDLLMDSNKSVSVDMINMFCQSVSLRTSTLFAAFHAVGSEAFSGDPLISLYSPYAFDYNNSPERFFSASMWWLPTKTKVDMF